jgi:hypothetical protein
MKWIPTWLGGEILTRSGDIFHEGQLTPFSRQLDQSPLQDRHLKLVLSLHSKFHILFEFLVAPLGGEVAYCSFLNPRH